MLYAMGAIVALAAGAAMLFMTSAVVSATWGSWRRRIARIRPQERVHLLAALRLLPAAVALAAGAAVSIAFVRLEPVEADEQIGVVLLSLAGAAVAAFGWRILTTARVWQQTKRVVKSWDAQPLAIQSAFPIVAVVGIWRPRLYVSRQVVEACDREELDAMFAHERAHIAAGDNLTRLLFLATPFAAVASAREIELAWSRAAEETADDAARRDARTALALASALTKVARLAAGQPMPLLHVSAIFSGSDVSDRVRRLLDTPAPVATHDWAWRCGWLVAAGCVTAASVAAMRPIYDAAEFCVRYLP